MGIVAGAVSSVSAIPGSIVSVIGIDPGRKGALVKLNRAAYAARRIYDMPKGPDGLDLVGLLELLGQLVTPGCKVMIESCVTIKGKNGSGKGFGTYRHEHGQLLGAVTAAFWAVGMRPNVEQVTPIAWKSVFGLAGQGKVGPAQYLLDRKLATVQELTLARARTPSDGRSDALMIAMYAAIREGWNAFR